MAVSSNQVRLLSSTDAGAPTLAYTAGQMIALLDALLVNGYGEVTLTSLAVASNIATATVSGGHGFVMRGSAGAEVGPVIRIAGATPSALNGDWRIEVTSSTEFTFEVSGISDQTATGTITGKMAPLGWSKPYTGTNLAAFRMGGGSQRYLRVADTATYDARICGYEDMTGISTGTGQFPTEIQRAGGLYLAKRNTSTGYTNWHIVGTDRLFYLFTSYHSTNAAFFVTIFGDLPPLSPSDDWSTYIGGSISSYSSYTTQGCPWYLGSSGEYGYSPRPIGGVGGSVSCQQLGLSFSVTSGISGSIGLIDYPNPTDGALILTGPIYAGSFASNGYLRGLFPGALFVNNYVYTTELGDPGVLSTFDLPQGSGYLAGARVMLLGFASGSSAYGWIVLDPVGPWT